MRVGPRLLRQILFLKKVFMIFLDFFGDISCIIAFHSFLNLIHITGTITQEATPTEIILKNECI